jgi:hypothetical protein
MSFLRNTRQNADKKKQQIDILHFSRFLSTALKSHLSTCQLYDNTIICIYAFMNDLYVRHIRKGVVIYASLPREKHRNIDRLLTKLNFSYFVAWRSLQCRFKSLYLSCSKNDLSKAGRRPINNYTDLTYIWRGTGSNKLYINLLLTEKLEHYSYRLYTQVSIKTWKLYIHRMSSHLFTYGMFILIVIIIEKILLRLEELL